MKEKILDFLQSKKEVIVFIGLLSVTFLSVILIANATIVTEEDDMVVVPSPEQDDDLGEQEEDVTIYDFVLPFNGDKVVVRDFYNILTPGENADAIVETNGVYSQSKGTSYANEDNTTFDVISIYPGKVISVEENETLGRTITIDHGNEVYSVYSALATSNVVEGDEISQNDIIGTAGTSTYDIKAGVHVHVKVISYVDDIKNYIDIEEIVGKTIDDIVSSIK